MRSRSSPGSVRDLHLTSPRLSDDALWGTKRVVPPMQRMAEGVKGRHRTRGGDVPVGRQALIRNLKPEKPKPRPVAICLCRVPFHLARRARAACAQPVVDQPARRPSAASSRPVVVLSPSGVGRHGGVHLRIRISARWHCFRCQRFASDTGFVRLQGLPNSITSAFAVPARGGEQGGGFIKPAGFGECG